MPQFTRFAALSGSALAFALALGAPAAVSAASVTPHVFDGGITLVDLAGENLHPWGFYDGTKGVRLPPTASGSETATPVAAAGPVPGGWIPAAGWSVPAGETGSPGVPLLAPAPVPAGFAGPRDPTPCFWGDDRFGSIGSRDRCGYPASQVSAPGRPPLWGPTPSWIVLVTEPRGAVPSQPGGPAAPPVPIPLPAPGWLLGAALFACFWGRRR